MKPFVHNKHQQIQYSIYNYFPTAAAISANLRLWGSLGVSSGKVPWASCRFDEGSGQGSSNASGSFRENSNAGFGMLLSGKVSVGSRFKGEEGSR